MNNIFTANTNVYLVMSLIPSKNIFVRLSGTHECSHVSTLSPQLPRTMLTLHSLSHRLVEILLDIIFSISEPLDLLHLFLTSKYFYGIIVPDYLEYRPIRCPASNIDLWLIGRYRSYYDSPWRSLTQSLAIQTRSTSYRTK